MQSSYACFVNDVIGLSLLQNFVDFELEPHQDCSYDNIEIFDGANKTAMLLGKFCGSRKPTVIMSSSNQMYLVFYSDASVQRRGFRATYSTGLLPYLTDKTILYDDDEFSLDLLHRWQ